MKNKLIRLEYNIEKYEHSEFKIVEILSDKAAYETEKMFQGIQKETNSSGIEYKINRRIYKTDIEKINTADTQLLNYILHGNLYLHTYCLENNKETSIKNFKNSVYNILKEVIAKYTNSASSLLKITGYDEFKDK